MSARVFITGGAGGLGRELARIYAARGARVLIGDLDLAAAEATAAEIGAQAIACDVRSEADFAAVAQWIGEHWGGLDILINNAGVAQMGTLAKTSMEDWHWSIDINLLGPVRGIKALLPQLGTGAKIVNVASMSALFHLPGSAAYSATKAGLLAVSETLMLELEDRGISTHVVCPSFFRSDLARNMRGADEKAAKVTSRLVERARIGAAEIAAIVVKGVDRGDPHIFTDRDSRRTMLLRRILPFRTMLGLIRKQSKMIEARVKRAQKGPQ